MVSAAMDAAFDGLMARLTGIARPNLDSTLAPAAGRMKSGASAMVFANGSTTRSVIRSPARCASVDDSPSAVPAAVRMLPTKLSPSWGMVCRSRSIRSSVRRNSDSSCSFWSRPTSRSATSPVILSPTLRRMLPSPTAYWGSASAADAASCEGLVGWLKVSPGLRTAAAIDCGATPAVSAIAMPAFTTSVAMPTSPW